MTVLLGIACGSDGAADQSADTPSASRAVLPTTATLTATPSPTVVATAEVSAPSGPVTLAAGRFELPAASAFGEPGFHEVFELTGTVAGDVPTGGGGRLVVSLRDVSRPSQDCRSHHPLSGCATVDWADETCPGEVACVQY